MTSGNVEIAKRAYEAFNRRDFDALRGVFHEDLEWHQFTDFPDRAVYRGRDDVIERFLQGQIIEQFGDFTVEVDEYVDAGDHVGVIGEIVGHGTASGAAFRLRIINILEYADGQLVRAYDLSGPPVPFHASDEGLK